MHAVVMARRADQARWDGNLRPAPSRYVARSSHLHDVHEVCAIENGCIVFTSGASERCAALEYTDVLRLLAINDARFGEECAATGRIQPGELDPKTLALVRWLRWSRSGVRSRPTGQTPMPRWMRVRPRRRSWTCSLVWCPSSVCRASSPRLRSSAMALGYDVEDALEQQSVVRRLRAEQADRGRLVDGVAPRRDPELPVDRADLRADRVAGHEQPLADLTKGEVGLEIGEQAQLGRAEW